MHNIFDGRILFAGASKKPFEILLHFLLVKTAGSSALCVSVCVCPDLCNEDE